MAEFQSFAQVLEQKIRRKIEQDILVETTSPSTSSSEMPSPLWTHLIGHLQPQHFSTTQQGQIYHRQRPAPKPRVAHKLTAEQAQSLAFFRCHHSDLADNFTKAELKSAFRQLALKLHPDQGGKAEHFCSLKNALENLQTVFKA